MMQKPKLGPPPTEAQVAQARQAMVEAFVVQDTAMRHLMELIERREYYQRLEADRIARENMREPKR